MPRVAPPGKRLLKRAECGGGAQFIERWNVERLTLKRSNPGSLGWPLAKRAPTVLRGWPDFLHPVGVAADQIRNPKSVIRSSGFDWRIYADATCAGLSVLIPLPFVDTAFETVFRRRIPGTIARALKSAPSLRQRTLDNPLKTKPSSALLWKSRANRIQPVFRTYPGEA